uniref:Tumor necrosis factor receptor superfamily member 6 n=1 Tax=Oplegnathus fasciatus TaxID=163134 RepID=K0J1H9_OPLFA|nr:tumor necrosis factor receptor superfamily member 6 [Oplegnathus fasciatus]
MMADSKKFRASFITFVLHSYLVLVALSQTEATNRGQCQDGTYKHEGRECCLCAAGLHLEQHCSTNLTQGKCKACPSEMYKSHPTSEVHCEPCTSCSQQNANLMEAEPCTPGKDRKCRCKEDHYCDSVVETCTLCQPCTKCGAEGIKADCTATSNRVCNDKIQEGNHNAGTIAAITVTIVIIVLAAIAALIWKKKEAWKRKQTAQQSNGNAADPERQPLRVPDVDLQPHMSDIAEVIGWKVMQDVAMRSSIPDTTIESCQLDQPNNSQEQTRQLLKIFAEIQGRGASEKLVEILENSGRRRTAEKVVDILHVAARSNLPA